MSELSDRLRETMREIPDFPKPGIRFKDITPILQNPLLCGDIVSALADRFRDAGVQAIAGIESRGFLFGMMLAQLLQVPFVVIRKKGKLPYKTISFKYDLEYGSAEMEIHVDALLPGSKVLIHDDLLATGGTAAAAAELVRLSGGQVVGFAFVVELSELNGLSKISPYSNNICNLITF
jgi:adenine phosphoribosyltransferase